MKRLVGGPIHARFAAAIAPKGYFFSPPGFGFGPGRILWGPENDSTTTVCLVDGDDGQWFKDEILTRKGWFREEEPQRSE